MKVTVHEARQKVVPGCGLTLEPQWGLVRRLSDQVVCHVLDGCEVGWRVMGSDPAFIITEDHIHDPMQAVLDRPMAADDRSGQARHQAEQSDICERIGSGQHGEQAQEKDLVERVVNLPLWRGSSNGLNSHRFRTFSTCHVLLHPIALE
jgi:hypothetical protein